MKLMSKELKLPHCLGIKVLLLCRKFAFLALKNVQVHKNRAALTTFITNISKQFSLNDTTGHVFTIQVSTFYHR